MMFHRRKPDRNRLENCQKTAPPEKNERTATWQPPHTDTVDVNYFFEASIDTFLNSFNDFSKSNEALRARCPAALFPFST